ncbi:hypothetical protein D9M71_786070 [compost metagenome]
MAPLRPMPEAQPSPVERTDSPYICAAPAYSRICVPIVLAPAMKISRYSTGIGLFTPSRLIDSAAAMKNATLTLTRL